MKPTFVVVALATLIARPLQATSIDYVRDVRPILQTYCYACHGPQKQKSGLRLDIKSEAFKGGDGYGTSIVAGKSRESPLLELVSSDDEDARMPPEGDPLPPDLIATLAKWIDEGALWPDGVDLATLEDKTDHWSFKPPTRSNPPATAGHGWPRNPIDRFVLARLEKEGLRPAPETDAAAWLRRVTLDLTGLPPTDEERATFLAQIEPAGQYNAADVPSDGRRLREWEQPFEEVVDRLLRSPRYGERAAQQWLDLVRYADTHGFEVNTERPNAWPYRDYVIEAFNNDTPYDRFIREQIVGDVMGQDAATGFLVTASVLLPGQIGADEPSKRLARQDSLDEIVVNIGQTFLGLSVGCARCHDHKFDPISQRDYYAMQAFVSGVEYGERELNTPAAKAARAEAARLKARVVTIDGQLARLAPMANSGAERPAVNARENTDRFVPVKATRLRFTIRGTNSLEPCIDELEVFDASGANVALASAGTMVTSSGDKVVSNRHELRQINDGQYGNSRSWMSNTIGKGWVVLTFADERLIERVTWGRDREGKFNDRLATDYVVEVADGSDQWRMVADSSDRRKFKPGITKPKPFSVQGLSMAEAARATTLLREKGALQSGLNAVESGLTAFAGTFRTPDSIRLLNRGDPEQPKDVVDPAVPHVLGSLSLPASAAEPTRRAALADWIANPSNPLTARVMVNRIWQGHFGTGLVETASDLGRTGTKPSHPELLDWLAAEFVRSGWSIKRMHRLMVLSATYRQSTRHDATAAAKDADVRLLWRYPSRRMEAEMIRDAMLAVSGKLDLKVGGPGFNLFDKRGGLSGFEPVESFRGDGLRRMIYAHKVRRERDAVFGAFDCPDGGQGTSRRRESTTPIQALNLFNSQFTLEQAEAFATRAANDAGDDVGNHVRRAYRLALARDATDQEVAEARPLVQQHGLPILCRALFNSNEFLFLP